MRVERHEVEVRKTGHRFTYTYLTQTPSVMVVAITAEGRIVVIRQYRYPSQEYSYEMPGGGVGEGEPAEAAVRELEEETGFRARRVEKMGEFVVYCGLADEVCHVFLATELERGEPRREQTEQIETHEIGWDRVQEMIREGAFRDGMGLSSLMLARERLEMLCGT